MINAVLNEPRLGEFDRSSLRLIFYGGGPMPPAVLERALQTFDCDFTQGYGLTETLEATFLVCRSAMRSSAAGRRCGTALLHSESLDGDKSDLSANQKLIAARARG